jgi:hypothetical protein
MELTQEQLKDICDRAAIVGANEAIKVYDTKRKKEADKRVDKRLRNTKLLLVNYRMLKEHAESSVYGRTQMGESASAILESMMDIYEDDVIIESIKRSATRTAIIVSHIDTMLEIYEAYCEKSINKELELRRYNALWSMYIADNPIRASEIADMQSTTTRAVYDDIKIAMERLSALLFGVDGLLTR